MMNNFHSYVFVHINVNIERKKILGPFGATILGLFLTEYYVILSLEIIFFLQNGQEAPTDGE